MERRILDFWRESRIFEKSLELREGASEWVFYEGPPTANGRPGIHHVEARTFKDVYPRFKTMTGHYVPRKAGWDCHGLPVELEVEKEIGTKTKSDIEAFGIAEFTRLCRESVTRYVADWERLTERIGFWINLEDAYWTMDTSYVESVWWSLKQLHRRGLLFEADKVTAYCPRCGTALSDAEVALGYAEVEDPSLFIKLPIAEAGDDALVGAWIAVWTTTPWTLLSNLGLAVSADADYVEVKVDGQRLIVAEALREAVFGESSLTGRTWKGSQLAGARYEPAYENVTGGSVHTVVTADYVSLEDGTGVVHIAPAFGAEDLDVGRENGWPTYNPVDAEGRFTSRAPEFVHGRFVKDADPHIVEDLSRRGVVIRAETLLHNYPLCWRCKTPLIYYARTSWYVGTTQKRERLLEVNQNVNWYPEHIREGRYGNWLENNVDWALSRERYWGTPLPLWRCEQDHVTAVGSLKELSELAGRDVTGVDPHRPTIDEVAFDCPECSTTTRRVTEVIDTWYDSGAMPYAQWGYHPELGRGVDRFEERFPADFISEAIDQTRGWFYTLMAEAVLLFDDTAYRNVVCLGHLVAGDGRKMSKSLGNVIDPWSVLDRQGADALRWFLLTNGSPWASRRISPEILDDVVRQFILTIWNVYSFFVTYANADGFDPTAQPDLAIRERPLLDRWILSQLADTVARSRGGLESYDATGAGRRIAAFVDDLSNWYVRRSRRRFWDPAGTEDGTEDGTEKLSAYQTLYRCLVTLARLLAPFVPFLSEELWRNLSGPDGPESVHLSDYPDAESREMDADLDTAMSAARAIVSLGRTIRNDAKMKVRQPLSEAVVHYPGDRSAMAPLLPTIAEELNVKEVLFAESAEQLAGWRAKPNFRSLGPKLGPRVKDLAAVLADDDGSIAGALAKGEAVTVEIAGSAVSLEASDVDLSQDTKAGWGVAADGGLTVALDLELDEDLRTEGLAREIVRLIQDARRESGFDVSDRIHVRLTSDERVAAAAARHADYISGETLALSLDVSSPAGDDAGSSVDGSPVGLDLRRA
jgi:isoleucyl-tRNA synthetase